MSSKAHKTHIALSAPMCSIFQQGSSLWVIDVVSSPVWWEAETNFGNGDGGGINCSCSYSSLVSCSGNSADGGCGCDDPIGGNNQYSQTMKLN